MQADIKTITVLGGYAMSAITALTAQNTEGVKEILPVSPDFISLQMIAILEDLGADAVKIGMLGKRDAVEAVAQVLGGLTPFRRWFWIRLWLLRGVTSFWKMMPSEQCGKSFFLYLFF